MQKHWNDLLDKKARQSLSAEEEKQYEELYATEHSFREAAAFIYDVKAVAEAQDDQDFKSLLASFEVEQPKSRFSFKKQGWYVAASIVILMAISAVLLLNKPIDNEALYAEYFSPHANTLAPVERNETTSTSLEKALLAYENKEYVEALAFFEESEEANSTAVDFYKACSYMAISQIEDALPLLKKVSTSEDAYATYAHWYLALSYLKNNDVPNAKIHLETIVTRSYYPYEKAKQLLGELP